MRRRLFTATLMASIAALAASTGSHAAYVSRAIVNTDGSITIQWTLASTEISNTSVAVDCCVVHTWYGVDRSTAFTTAPLPAGRHTITLEVLEMTWTNTDFGPEHCRVSPRTDYRWVCTWRRWTSVTVRVPASTTAHCVVPRLNGLRLEVAKQQIRRAGCSVGTLTRRNAGRASGVVLAQQPKPGTQLATGAPVGVVVSKGTAPR